MLKIRRPSGRLIFNMGIAIPGETVFLIETAPRSWGMMTSWYNPYSNNPLYDLIYDLSAISPPICVQVEEPCHGLIITYTSIIWNVILYPWLKYLPLIHKSTLHVVISQIRAVVCMSVAISSTINVQSRVGHRHRYSHCSLLLVSKKQTLNPFKGRDVSIPVLTKDNQNPFGMGHCKFSPKTLNTVVTEALGENGVRIRSLDWAIFETSSEQVPRSPSAISGAGEASPSTRLSPTVVGGLTGWKQQQNLVVNTKTTTVNRLI